ncbi:class I SAM-dependent methyltransferase [Haloechinothrix aidingensis]|nr:class I SAM-dependent methyltransferase [Haloechinothrix aidingensis]
MTEHRRSLLTGLSGEIVEVGAGNGLNFAHYPPSVTRVLAVEPEPHLREAATGAARLAAVPVRVVDGLAEELPAADGSFDAAVVSVVLCSVPDQVAALGEIHRVLGTGAQLRFLEHVGADTPGMRRVQRLIDGTVGPRVFGGCHCGRDTEGVIESAGFRIDRIERFLFPGARTPHSFHILGTAVRDG